MTITITIDPLNLVPIAADSDERFENQVEDLLGMREELSNGWLRLAVKDGLLELLADVGLLPLPDALQEVMRSLGVEIWAAADVARVVYALLEMAETLEHIVGAEAILVDEVTFNPDGLFREALPEVVEASRATFGLVALAQANAAGLSPLVVSAYWDELPDVAVSGEVVAIDRVDGTICSVGEGTFATQIHVAPDLRSAMLRMNPHECLDDDVDTDSLAHMICLAVHKFRSLEAGHVYRGERVSTLVTSGFAESYRLVVRRGPPALAEKSLQAIVEVLERRNLPNSHALRVSSGGGSKPRTHGPWTAMRHDVDADIHLHYWVDGDRVQLACICPHNDFSIPAPLSD